MQAWFKTWAALALTFVVGFASANAQRSLDYSATKIADGLERPWDITFLDDDIMLVTERPGRLRVVKNGQLQRGSVQGLPQIFSSRQAGLFEVTKHPRFELNQLLYFTVAVREGSKSTLALFRGTWSQTGTGYRLDNVTELYRVSPARDNTVHYGGRILFLNDGTLLMTSGDAGQRWEAQELDSEFGKILRLNDDGSIPANNPFARGPEADDAIYSLGHRNPQGISFGPRGQVFSNEHGPQGGDEINIIEAGANYAWPLATFGREYSGAVITDDTSYPGTKDPEIHWTPSIAPSSLMFYRGNHYSQINGYFLTSALSGQHIRATRLSGGSAREVKLLDHLNLRWRNVALSPDGFLYGAAETNSGNGSVWRIEPQ